MSLGRTLERWRAGLSVAAVLAAVVTLFERPSPTRFSSRETLSECLPYGLSPPLIR
jgi:hypothetical protein